MRFAGKSATASANVACAWPPFRSATSCSLNAASSVFAISAFILGRGCAQVSARYDAPRVRKARPVSQVKEKELYPAKEQEAPPHRGQVESTATPPGTARSEEHTSELQSQSNL